MPGPAKQTAISPELLRRAGHALYGHLWQTTLARDLEMSDRSLRYMSNGQRGISEGVAADLLKLVETRRDELTSVADEIADSLPD